MCAPHIHVCVERKDACFCVEVVNWGGLCASGGNAESGVLCTLECL